MKSIFFLVLGLLLGGCAETSHMLVLPYSDFGPQAAAYEFIGFEWYQWHSHGDSNPDTRYDIRVVVYDDTVRLSDVKRRFPVVPENNQDFRYVSLDSASKYLDARSKEYSEIKMDIPEVIERWRATRKKLDGHFNAQTER